jgi:uncharacterized membrane protein YdjX (TVP38/TMEM64 family)
VSSTRKESKSVGKKQKKTSKLPLILSLSLLAALVACYFLLPGFQKAVQEAYEVLTSEDEERIREWVSQFGAWGPIVILIGMILQMFLFIIPNILLILICILSYGPVWGGLLAWFGIFLASTVGYFIGNKLSPVIVDKLVSEKTQDKLQDFISHYGMKAIFVLRVSSLSNDGLSLVAGLLEMKYRRFITATMLGMTPLIAALAILGDRGKIEKGLIWIGGFLLICLIAYIIIDKRKSKKKKT